MPSASASGYPEFMFRLNPRGRQTPAGKLIHIGLGDRVHAMNPTTGRAMCAPKLADVSPADGDQVTCYRCQHLMQINRTLRGSDFAVGGAQVLVDAAARAGMK